MFFHHLKPSLSPEFYKTASSLFSFYFSLYLSFPKIGFIFGKNEDIQKGPFFEINNFLRFITHDKPKIKKTILTLLLVSYTLIEQILFCLSDEKTFLIII